MKVKKDYQSYVRLIGYAKKQIPLFVVCTLICGAMVFLVFSSIGVLLSSVVAAVSGEKSQNSFVMLLYVIGVFGFAMLASFTQVGFIHIEQKTQMTLRQKMIHTYLRMEESKASDYPSTEVLNRLTTDVPNCTKSIGYYMSSMVFQPMLSGIFSILLLLIIDWRIAILCIICTLINLFCSQFAIKQIRALKANIINRKSDTSNFVQECVKGEIEMRSFGLFSLFERKLDARLQKTESNIQKFSRLQGLRIQLYLFSGDCLTVISLLILGALLASAHLIQFSDIMISLPLSDQIAQMMASFGNCTAIIRQASPHMERVFEIIDLQKEDQVQQATSNVVNASTISEGVSFSNVSFSYGQQSVLKDISFSVMQGEKVAFVGESGSGKSTIIKLLLGLYYPDTGTVQVCGQQLGSCSMEEWRKGFSYLPQEISMLHLSISQNIALHSKSDSKEVQIAAKKANADEFISKTEDNYDLLLGENSTGFSGGQLQRIALARCLFKNAPVILMDEPTSALDSDSEQAVKQTIDQLPDSCTVVAVTHRLQLARDFDRLYVVEKGRIVESGTHQQLLEKGGKYTHLWQLQHG